MSNNEAVQQRIESVVEAMQRAVLRSGRSRGDVLLVAVSKKQDVSAIESVCRALSGFAGCRYVLGESYVQEARRKREQLTVARPFHLIGPLQSNKVREAVRFFDVIESVHTTQIAQLINQEASKLNKVQEIFLQVNISNDQAKSGFAISSLEQFLIETLPQLSNLRLLGLMTITRLYENPEESRNDFQKMRMLRDRLLMENFTKAPLLLSMGMSSDFEIALEEGADLVRIGTALFGERA